MAIGLKRLIEMLVIAACSKCHDLLMEFRSHKEQVSKNTGVDLEKLFKTTYLHEFDR